MYCKSEVHQEIFRLQQQVFYASLYQLSLAGKFQPITVARSQHGFMSHLREEKFTLNQETKLMVGDTYIRCGVGNQFSQKLSFGNLFTDANIYGVNHLSCYFFEQIFCRLATRVVYLCTSVQFTVHNHPIVRYRTHRTVVSQIFIEATFFG